MSPAPTQELPEIALFYLTLFAFAALFLLAFCDRFGLFRFARADARLANPGARARTFVVYVLAQRRLLTQPYGGILHALIFWGFVTLALRSINFLLDGIDGDASLQSLLGDVFSGYGAVMDSFNVLVLVGVTMALYRRLVTKPARLTLNRDALGILSLIAGLMIADLLTNGTDLALLGGRDLQEASYASFGISRALDGIDRGALDVIHIVAWWSHLLILMTFLAYLPFSKHLHVITAAPNVYLRSLRPTGTLFPIPALQGADVESVQRFGAGAIYDFTWKQLLDTYSCTECGRCEDACPASMTGKTLSPKKIMHDLRQELQRQPQGIGLFRSRLSPDEAQPMIPNAVTDEELWACYTCGACMEACPVFIEHVPTIVDMRRHLVMDEARMPETVQATLETLERQGHPWRGTPFTRETWMEGLDVPAWTGREEYLYFVGCTGALVDRAQPVVRSLATLLRQAGVSFGVLAGGESCNGDPARRLGNEYLFQILAQQLIATFNDGGVQKIITNCPHCFNTFKNEYPDLGGAYEVIHHTQLLEQLVEQGVLVPKNGVARTVTYHDACYLGRHNDIYSPPRRVLERIPNVTLVEMPRNCEKGLCCGAGGGTMWMDEGGRERVNEVRTQEAIATGADAVATACPFCIQMLEAGVDSLQTGREGPDRLAVFDVAELLEVAVTSGEPASGEPASGEPASGVPAPRGDEERA